MLRGAGTEQERLSKGEGQQSDRYSVLVEVMTANLGKEKNENIG